MPAAASPASLLDVPAPPALRIHAVTKDYGSGRGIFDLDLTVPAGEVFGYLGPNGAGKTTTIRLLLDLIRPTAGRLEVLGLDSRRDSVDVRRRIGYLPGDLALYEALTGWELLTYFAKLRRLTDMSLARRLAERVQLDVDRPIRELSKGNRQKIGLVQALMHRPELLVLDEPTAGLDPIVQEAVHDLLRAVAEEGRTVFLSSHVLAEVERIADRVAIVRDGRLVVVQAVGTLKARAVRHLEFQFAEPVDPAAFDGLPGVRSVRADAAWVRLEVEGAVDAAVKAAARFPIVNVTSHEPDLEEIFLAYYRTREEADGAAG